MKNSFVTHSGFTRAAAALAIFTLAACTPAAKTETKVASADSAKQTPMTMPMENGMPMGQMKGGCPLSLKALALSPAQQATFDSIKADHKKAMEREMDVALARARAVLTPAQRVTFDSASTAHKAQMDKMMSAGGGCMM